MDYKDRFVAFIRILDYEKLIQHSLKPGGTIVPDEIIKALEVPTPAESGRVTVRPLGVISEAGHRMTAFASNIAITVEPTAQGLLYLLHHVAKMGFRLIRLSPPAFCRGGIIRGLVYHNGEVILGPGLMAAFELERQARYPRVIISEAVTQVGLAAAPPADAMIKRFVRQDESDGVQFVNILRVLRMAMDYENEPPEHLRALSDYIEKHLQQESARLAGEEREQVLWFQKYFAWATDRSMGKT